MNDDAAAPTLPETARAAREARLWRALGGACLAYYLFLLALAPRTITADAAMYLHTGQLLLGGKLPYVDFFELNPPLVMYLSAIPAAAAKGIGADPIPVFRAMVWLLAVASTVSVARSLRDERLGFSKGEAAFVAALWAGFFLFVAATAGAGQREHLFALTYFPFFLIRFRRYEGSEAAASSAALWGAAAGAVACVKPHFIAIAAAPELYWLATRPRRAPLFRPEVFAVAAVGAAYGAHFLLLPREMREAFFGRWAPLIARGYAAFDDGWAAVLSRPVAAWTAAALAALAALRPLSRRVGMKPAGRLGTSLAVASAAAFGAFAVQRKGWAHQALPAAAALWLYFGVLWTVLRRRIVGRETSALGRAALRAEAAAAAAAAAAFFVYAGLVHAENREREESRGTREAIRRYSRPGEAVLVLSTNVEGGYPMIVQEGRTAGLPYLWLFSTPMFYVNYDRDERSRCGRAFCYGATGGFAAEERRAAEEIRRALEEGRPPVVVLDASRRRWHPAGFDLPEWLKAMGVGTALRDYVWVGTEERPLKGERYATFARSDRAGSPPPP